MSSTVAWPDSGNWIGVMFIQRVIVQVPFTHSVLLIY